MRNKLIKIKSQEVQTMNIDPKTLPIINNNIKKVMQIGYTDNPNVTKYVFTLEDGTEIDILTEFNYRALYVNVAVNGTPSNFAGRYTDEKDIDEFFDYINDCQIPPSVLDDISQEII